MRIWTNTNTLDGYLDDFQFTNEKKAADIALLGGKPIQVEEFKNLKGIFRVGVSRDNLPIEEARRRGVLVGFPSQETIEIIFEETACFTCYLIFKMLYQKIGTLEPWYKNTRVSFQKQNLLVVGQGNIGKRVANKMKYFLNVDTFDILQNQANELQEKLMKADCVTLHIPKTDGNLNFLNENELKLLKDGAVIINTARGPIVNEDALYSEIKSGRLRAAFDVFWQEPYNGKLKEFHPNQFFMTPHVASTCDAFLEGSAIDFREFIKEAIRD